MTLALHQANYSMGKYFKPRTFAKFHAFLQQVSIATEIVSLSQAGFCRHCCNLLFGHVTALGTDAKNLEYQELCSSDVDILSFYS